MARANETRPLREAGSRKLSSIAVSDSSENCRALQAPHRARRQLLVERLHRLGPAPLAHFIREVEGALISAPLRRLTPSLTLISCAPSAGIGSRQRSTPSTGAPPECWGDQHRAAQGKERQGISLPLPCFAGCDAPDVLAELRRRSLIEVPGADTLPRRFEPRPTPSKAASEPPNNEAKRKNMATWLWGRREPV
jgi:hypothetical protein